ncbi:response regulator [Aggregatilinea lenta]|uniref:response regulator n=1 Tax=Aggregatilinea lenta TaxID=913108 RepID=UPI000E5AAAED|nr:response regulator [Aggregatilinea lenta]
MAQILLVDDDLNLLQMVRLMLQRLGHDVVTSREGEEGLRLAAEIQPDLAIIDIMMPGLSGYDVVNRLRFDPKTAHVPIIILTARSQPMDKHKALRAGANAFISKPVTAQELADRVEAVLEAGVGFRINTGLLAEPVSADLGPPPPSTGTLEGKPTLRETAPFGPTEPPNATRPPWERPQPGVTPALDRVLEPLPLIAVVGLRGGTGSTTVAVNLACWLAAQKRAITLVDLSTSSGHVPLHLHLTPPKHWGSLLHHVEPPDERTVKALLIRHAETGMAVLAAPPMPPVETLGVPIVEHLLRTLSAGSGTIVLDVPQLDLASAHALRLARVIVLVLSDDPASIQTGIQSLMVFEQMGIPASRIKLVLNHVRRTRDIPAETVQKVLKRTLAVEVPFEPEQINAIRRGAPLVSTAAGSDFTRAIQQLARHVEG